MPLPHCPPPPSTALHFLQPSPPPPPHNLQFTSEGVVKIFSLSQPKDISACTIVNRPDKTTYMSPERIQGGQGRCPHKSDIWAAGLILCECLLGHYPYRAANGDFVHLLLEITRNRPIDFPADCKDHCKDFVTSCLRQSPHERPSAPQLLRHPFLTGHAADAQRLAQFLRQVGAPRAPEAPPAPRMLNGTWSGAPAEAALSPLVKGDSDAADFESPDAPALLPGAVAPDEGPPVPGAPGEAGHGDPASRAAALRPAAALDRAATAREAPEDGPAPAPAPPDPRRGLVTVSSYEVNDDEAEPAGAVGAEEPSAGASRGPAEVETVAARADVTDDLSASRTVSRGSAATPRADSARTAGTHSLDGSSSFGCPAPDTRLCAPRGAASAAAHAAMLHGPNPRSATSTSEKRGSGDSGALREGFDGE